MRKNIQTDRQTHAGEKPTSATAVSVGNYYLKNIKSTCYFPDLSCVAPSVEIWKYRFPDNEHFTNLLGLAILLKFHRILLKYHLFISFYCMRACFYVLTSE